MSLFLKDEGTKHQRGLAITYTYDRNFGLCLSLQSKKPTAFRWIDLPSHSLNRDEQYRSKSVGFFSRYILPEN